MLFAGTQVGGPALLMAATMQTFVEEKRMGGGGEPIRPKIESEFLPVVQLGRMRG